MAEKNPLYVPTQLCPNSTLFPNQSSKLRYIVVATKCEKIQYPNCISRFLRVLLIVVMQHEEDLRKQVAFLLCCEF